MTEDQVNQLIELGRINPNMAATAQDLARLAELATDPIAKNIVTQMMRGYLSCVDDPCEGFLRPAELNNPTTTHRGQDGVLDVQTFTGADGIPIAVWRSTSFLHRLQFLYDGMLAVVYASGSPIPTLSLRLDLHEMGFKWEPAKKDY